MSRVRRWISTVFAAIAAVLFVLSLIWPQWIEGIFEASPDGGDGSFEVLSSVFLVIVAAVTGTDAVVGWRRARRARRTGDDLVPE